MIKIKIKIINRLNYLLSGIGRGLLLFGGFDVCIGSLVLCARVLALAVLDELVEFVAVLFNGQANVVV